MIKFQQSQALTSHFESFWSIVESRRAKICRFDIFWGSAKFRFFFQEFLLHFLKAEIYQNTRFRAPKIANMPDFELLYSPKLDFKGNLSALCSRISRNVKLRPTVWKLMNFIATQFQVKSILARYECEKLPFFTISGTRNFEFW